jgi:2-C-methyl-D-erythritol 4-phosphate cytidylyltransferase/2-C-methyl-D-erythritol 2,4-cyclodiphosphate synthase
VDYVIVVAAGSGERLGAGMPKALVEIGGAPMLAWSLRTIDRCDRVRGVVIAAPEGHEDEIRDAIPHGLRVEVAIVAGGSSRQRSVRAALAVVPADATAVAVHDAARPLVTAAVFDAVFDALADVAGAMAASPVADTLKRADARGAIARTVDRADLWRAETPQAFRADVLRSAFADATDDELDRATDDASMVEARGGTVLLIDSRTPNLKVTTPADAVIAASLLRMGG